VNEKKANRHFPLDSQRDPGLATAAPILFSEGCMNGRIDINRFVAVTSTKFTAKLYGL